MAKKYISKYTGPEIDSGLDNIPKLEGKLTELESEIGKSIFINKASGRVSQALLLEGGQSYRISISVKEGTDTSAWTLYRCKDGKLVAESYDSAIFGNAIAVDIPQGDDGVWLFTSAEFVGDRTYEVYYEKRGYRADKLNNLSEDVKKINSDINTINSDIKAANSKIADANSAINYISKNINKASGRLSEGLKLHPGRYVVLINNTKGRDTGYWLLYRYSNGTLVNEILTDSIAFGKSAIVDIPQGDDGVWLFTTKEFVGERTYEVNCEIADGISNRVTTIEKNLYDDTTNKVVTIESGRISYGIYIKSGRRYKISMSLSDGSDNGRWSLFRYTNNNIGDILTGSVVFGESAIVDIPQGDDGVWLFTSAEFVGERTYAIEIVDYSTIPNQLESAEKSINELSEKLDGIDGIKTTLDGVYKHISTPAINKRIAIWLDDNPSLAEYYLRVDCATPRSYSFYLYEASSNHASLNLLGHYKLGDTIKVVRNEQHPSLYIYDYTQLDEKEDGPIYDIDYLYNDISIESRLRKVEDISLSKWGGKVVCFGDSLTEYADLDKKYRYSDYISQIIGEDVINVGVGGAQIRQRTALVESPLTDMEAYAALDIVSMVDASCNQDFSKQEAAAQYLAETINDNNVDTIQRLSNINWSEVKMVTIFAGTNDWRSGAPVGEKDSTNIQETYGAINTIIKRLLTTYPHVQLYWFTPTIRWIASSLAERTDDKFSDNFKLDGVSLKDFSQNVMEVVKDNKIPICDMYNTLGWNQYNFSRFFPDHDGTHPTKNDAMERIAQKMVSFIKAN